MFPLSDVNRGSPKSSVNQVTLVSLLSATRITDVRDDRLGSWYPPESGGETP